MRKLHFQINTSIYINATTRFVKIGTNSNWDGLINTREEMDERNEPVVCGREITFTSAL